MAAWRVLILLVTAVAAIGDARWRQIPKWLTLPALATGLAYHLVTGGFGGALAAAVLGLGCGLVLLQLGAVGGGDVKWLAALGALLGWHLWLWSVEFGLLAAGGMALVQVVARGQGPLLSSSLAAIVQGWRRQGLRPHPQHNLQTPGVVAVPFAVAMLAGVVAAFALA
ncbi:MAG: prepilin peptidase [Terriglobales bacterium]